MHPSHLHPLFAGYVSSLERKGRDQKTVARAFYALRRLQGWLADLGIDPKAVTEVLLEEYVAWLKRIVAPTSAKSEAEKVKAAYRYAARIGMIEANPAEYVEAPTLPDTEPETYSNEELRQIRAAIRDDFEDVLFHGLSYTGMRRFELSKLLWEDVDFEDATLRVIGKAGKLRKVPLHPVLAEVLAQRKQKLGGVYVLGNGGSTRNMNHRLSKLLKRAGVDGGHRPAHRFRATVQSSLYEEGVREDVIDKILGWGPHSIRQRYYSRVPDRSLHDGILKLYESDPIERAANDRRELREQSQPRRRKSLALSMEQAAAFADGPEPQRLLPGHYDRFR